MNNELPCKNIINKKYVKIEKLLQNKFLSSITLQRNPELSFVTLVQILVNNIFRKMLLRFLWLIVAVLSTTEALACNKQTRVPASD